MKVILIKDVPKIGKRLDIKEIPNGYAMNFLIPRGLAILASPAEIAKRDKEVQSQKDSKALEDSLVESHFTKAADETLIIKMQANSEGHLFSGITAKMICEKLFSERHIDIPEKAIILEHHIKSLGPHEISLKYKDLRKTLHILVEAM